MDILSSIEGAVTETKLVNCNCHEDGSHRHLTQELFQQEMSLMTSEHSED